MQRIGRVGRFGRAGTAISLIPPYQVDKSSGRNYSIQHITEVSPASFSPSLPPSLLPSLHLLASFPFLYTGDAAAYLAFVLSSSSSSLPPSLPPSLPQAYHNTINRWDFLQGDYPPRDPFVLQLPGFGIEQDLLDGLKEGGEKGGVDDLAERVAGITMGK